VRSHQEQLRRNAQVERVLAIIRDLDRLDGVDLYELAERYGTAVRTIRRDLEALQAVGLPLIEERDGKRKRWRVAFRDRLSKLSGLFDASHYLALRLAIGHGGPATRTSTVFATLEDLAAKIEQALGPADRRRLEAIEAAFHSYDRHAYLHAPKDVFWPLVQAITERRVCQVAYRPVVSAEGKRKLSVLPLRLFVHDQAPYLVCLFLPRRAVGTLNLQRLGGLQVTERRAKPPANFDVERWESSAFGIFSGGKPTTYVLRFATDVAPYIRERVWHPSQKLREQRDGALELTFTCDASPEVSAWVASWRHWVEVIEPEELRQELAALGQQWLERYGSNATGQLRRAARQRRR
jgi:proteasome accessory factor B